MAKKIRVGVLYGGRSKEHEISILSAQNVTKALDKNRFDVTPIGITKQGQWLTHEASLPLPAAKLAQKNDASMRSLTILDSSQPNATPFDVIFPAIHGIFCEDGKTQGLLELANVPYVGCGVLGSAIAMDKDVTKRLALQAGVQVPPYCSIKYSTWLKRSAEFCKEVSNQLTYPVFVKPANTGSSIGIEKIHAASELPAAIEKAFQYDEKIVVEQGIDGLELEVGILENIPPKEELTASVVGEIKTTHEFYSYAAKYEDPDLKLIIPADIPTALSEQIQNTAKILFHCLDLSGMARMDFLVDKNTGEIYFNEANTIPGFTEVSMYPKLFNAAGVSYSELLTGLIELALYKHDKKTRLLS